MLNHDPRPNRPGDDPTDPARLTPRPPRPAPESRPGPPPRPADLTELANRIRHHGGSLTAA